MRKLLQINTAGGRGAAGGIPETLDAMAHARGIDAHLAVGRPNGSRAAHLMRIGSYASMAIHLAATRIADRHGLHSRPATLKLIHEAEALNPDIIHLHNIHGYYLHIPTLFGWLRGTGRPVVWTLHDCWTMTGHCSFFSTADCARWRTGCHDCPLRSQYPASLLFDRSEANYALKRRLFTSVPQLTLVSVSQWLDSVVAQSFMRDVPRCVIPNGIDLTTFRPCAPKAPGHSPLLLGVASQWDSRKGLDTFMWLRTQLPAHWRIRLIGLRKAQIRQLPDGIEGLLHISNAAELARHYSEATVFANPSLAEANNITKMEALACGTPVVTYAAGGAAEGINPGTGIAVAPGDGGALAAAVATAANGSFTAENCREAAISNYDMNLTLAGYFRLYEKLSPTH